MSAKRSFAGGHQPDHRCRGTNLGAGAKSHPRPIQSQLLETSTEGHQLLLHVVPNKLPAKELNSSFKGFAALRCDLAIH